MSVTFWIATEEEQGCYKQLAPEGFDPKQVVENDPAYGPGYAQNPWEMNLANGNAAAILGMLGADTQEGLCGRMSPHTMLKRIDAARIVTVPATQGVGASGCRWFDGGISEDYVANRFGQLAELAIHAIHASPDAFVCWG